jgi:hypothetical protein
MNNPGTPFFIIFSITLVVTLGLIKNAVKETTSHRRIKRIGEEGQRACDINPERG